MPEERIYPLAPVDDILYRLGLPKTKPLVDALSPRTVLGEKLGLRAPGDVIEDAVRGLSIRGPGGLFR